MSNNLPKVGRSLISSEIKKFNKNIWEKLTNNSNCHTRINPKIISEKEKNECKKIVDYAVKLIIAQFDRKTHLRRLVKTLTGYSVKLACTRKRSDCKSDWTFRIKLKTNEVNIINNYGICDHVLSEEPSNLLLKFLFKEFLNNFFINSR
jgi:predicted ATP-grasp superfamily ATP-dependent carboligase